MPLWVQWGARASWAHEEYVAITGTEYVDTPVGMVIGWKQLGSEAADFSTWLLRRPTRKSPPSQAIVSIGSPVSFVTTTSASIVVPVFIVSAGSWIRADSGVWGTTIDDDNEELDTGCSLPELPLSGAAGAGRRCRDHHRTDHRYRRLLTRSSCRIGVRSIGYRAQHIADGCGPRWTA